jgi:hypothetical protein
MSMAVAQAGVQEHGRGHIGLVVVGSIAGGLILGLMLVLGVFGGGQDSVIFLGLPWQHTRGSALLGFVKDDARYIADQLQAGRPVATTPGESGRAQMKPTETSTGVI